MTSVPAIPRTRAVLAAALAAAVLGACTSTPPAPPVQSAPPPPPAPATAPAPAPAAAPAAAGGPRYRCDHGITFTLQHGADSVTIDAGQRGRQILLRDAGGLTPQHTVYSNERLKAEFGVGAAGNEAILRYQEPPLLARCVRE